MLGRRKEDPREGKGMERNGMDRKERREGVLQKKKKKCVEGVARGMPYKVQARSATGLKKII